MLCRRGICIIIALGVLAIPAHGSSLRNRKNFGGSERAHNNKIFGANDVVCGICPDATLIQPCSCVCNNATSADIQCGPELTTCEQLTAILNVATPVSQYLRLVVQNTSLQCMLTNDIWGPTTFQEVILMENKFSILDNHAFAHFNKSMKVLNLEQNLLENVCFSTFNNQPHLEIINLNYNKIMFIPGLGNMDVQKLREIHLKGNSLTSVQESTFQLMPRLQIIDYSHNKISSIESGAFSFKNRFNDNTLIINLSNNLIQEFSQKMITGIQNMTLNLEYNYINDLSDFYNVLKDTDFKAKILLTGNPIICDPSLCWIIVNKNITNCFDNFQCINSPMKLYDLQIDDLGCAGLVAE